MPPGIRTDGGQPDVSKVLQVNGEPLEERTALGLRTLETSIHPFKALPSTLLSGRSTPMGPDAYRMLLARERRNGAQRASAHCIGPSACEPRLCEEGIGLCDWAAGHQDKNCSFVFG